MAIDATIQFEDVTVEVGDDFVATVEIHRPPSNFFDVALIRSLATAFAHVDAEAAVRASVLCAEGKHFCAGADFSGQSGVDRLKEGDTTRLYREAVRLFSTRKPFVAAVQGAAIGGGLGLACTADFRVAAPEARFAANFARLGFHHGFGLSVTLPAVVGQQRALELLYTGRRIGGEEAARLGLADRLAASAETVRDEAHAFAAEIAASAPLSLEAIRATMRGHLAAAVAEATDVEDREQSRLRGTEDFAEGVAASAERREPRFIGR